MNKRHRPVFSVIVPTYNRANLLSRAIRSVLNQVFTDFELIIADDASTDGTRKVVASFNDDRIVYICRDKNGGNACAKNNGILRAIGEYIAFLDDDDEYLPNFLAKMYGALDAAPETAGFAWCGVYNVEDTPVGEKRLGEELWQPRYDNREHAYLSFLRSRRISAHNGLTVRRSCFDAVGLFDENLRKAVDTDFLIRLIRDFDFIVVPEVLVKYHNHIGARVRTNPIWGAEAYNRILQKHLDTLLKHADLWVALHYKAGWQYYHAGNRRQGRKFMWQAIRKSPLDVKSWSGLLLFECLGSMGPHLHQKFAFLKTQIKSHLK